MGAATAGDVTGGAAPAAAGDATGEAAEGATDEAAEGVAFGATARRERVISDDGEEARGFSRRAALVFTFASFGFAACVVVAGGATLA